MAGLAIGLLRPYYIEVDDPLQQETVLLNIQLTTAPYFLASRSLAAVGLEKAGVK